jgi:hypothetical protein
MIDFMILGPPRSGTAWASVFFSTERATCLHEPLFDHFYQDLDGIAHDRELLGIASTGFEFFGEWVNRHPAKKLILHRPLDQVNRSLNRLGQKPCMPVVIEKLARINGLHVYWAQLFDYPRPLFEHLIGEGFDRDRHARLRQLIITSDFKSRQARADPHLAQRHRLAAFSRR